MAEPPPAAADVLVLRQDMTITREEFLRSVSGAVGYVAFTTAGDELRFAGDGRAWRIALAALPDLALGMFRLPRHRVEVFLTGYDDDAARRFVERFELYFRRGGG
ncbi:MAG: hypothetical protein U1F10_03120 [Burkholderiales bacterium]